MGRNVLEYGGILCANGMCVCDDFGIDAVCSSARQFDDLLLGIPGRGLSCAGANGFGLVEVDPLEQVTTGVKCGNTAGSILRRGNWDMFILDGRSIV